MKHLLLSIILFSFIDLAYSQFEQGNLIVSAEVEKIKYNDYSEIKTAGIALEYFITDYLTCSTRINFGENFSHMPLTVYFFADIFVQGLLFGEDDYYWLIFFSEGLNYHIPFGDNFSISPFIYPLGCEYIYQQDRYEGKEIEQEDYENWFITGSTGIRYNFHFDRIVFSPYFEYKLLYGQGTGGFGLGATLGLSLY